MASTKAIAAVAAALCILLTLHACGKSTSPAEPDDSIQLIDASIEADIVRPPDGTLNAVWVSPDGQAFAGGDNGAAWRFDGQDWRPLNVGMLSSIRAIAGRSGADVYVAGEHFVMHFDGTAWTRLPKPDLGTGDNFLALVADGAGGVCAATWGSQPGLMAFDGNVWTAIDGKSAGVRTSGEKFYGWIDLAGTGRDDLYALWNASSGTGGWPPDIYSQTSVSHHDATGWTDIFAATLEGGMNGIWASPAQDVVMVGNFQAFVRSASTWSRHVMPDSANVYDVWGAAADDVYAVGDGIIHFDGSTWTRAAVPSGEFLRGVSGAPGGDVFAVGAKGTVVRGHAGTWSVTSLGDVETLRGIWGRTADDIYAVGVSTQGDVILHYNGRVWEREYLTPPGGQWTLLDIWGTPDGPVYVVGKDGLILRREADAWRPMPTPAAIDLWTIHGCSGDTIYAIGDQGVLRFDGGNWAQVDTGWRYLRVWDAWCSPSGHVFGIGEAAGGRSTVVTFDGAAWASTPFDVGTYANFSHIAGSADDDVYIAGSQGVLRHFDGVEWKTIDVTVDRYLVPKWCVSVAGRDDVLLSRTVDEVVHRQGDTWTRYRATNLAGGVTSGGTDSAITTAVWRAPDGDLFCVSDGGVVVRYDF